VENIACMLCCGVGRAVTKRVVFQGTTSLGSVAIHFRSTRRRLSQTRYSAFGEVFLNCAGRLLVAVKTKYHYGMSGGSSSIASSSRLPAPLHAVWYL
jgi:hypothetical protein